MESYRDRRGNGKIGCFFHDNNEEDRLMQIHNSVSRTEKNVDSVIKALDSKMDTLVNHMIERSDPNVIPVSVLKYIVICMLVFNCAFIFGVPAAERILGKLVTSVGGQ